MEGKIQKVPLRPLRKQGYLIGGERSVKEGAGERWKERDLSRWREKGSGMFGGQKTESGIRGKGRVRPEVVVDESRTPERATRVPEGKARCGRVR